MGNRTKNPFDQVKLHPLPVGLQIFDMLKKAIINGTLPAGSRLVETRIAAWLGVSRTPLREALQRLEQDGWAERVPMGLQVIGLGSKEVKDLYLARAGLEGILTRTACEQFRPEQIEQVRQLTVNMMAALDRADVDAISATGRQIHGLLHEVADSRVAIDILRMLNDRLERYKNLSIIVPGRTSEAVEEHRQILAALEARDPDAAEQAMRRHILQGGRRIIEALETDHLFGTPADDLGELEGSGE